jgi:hypothetical protein
MTEVDIDNFESMSKRLKELKDISIEKYDEYKQKIRDSFQLDFENYLESQVHLFDQACWCAINQLPMTETFREKYAKKLKFGSNLSYQTICNRYYIQKIIALYEVNVVDSYNAVLLFKFEK